MLCFGIAYDFTYYTVSNHESVLDDPFLWGAMPLSTFFKVEKMRWVLGAADICYTTV